VRRSHKNIVGLIKAFALFLEKKPKSDFHLVLAGPEDKVYTEIPNTIESLNLKERVVFKGIMNDTDLAMLIKSASAYVFPSFYEGFGIPPLEAMQCLTPVTSSASSSLKEVCGSAALYFDPYKIDEIADSLLQITEDDKLREKLISAGKKQVQKFKWEDMVRTMYNKYLEILN
jgi:glycosyltransferase involved in cell wall biosynthesis